MFAIFRVKTSARVPAIWWQDCRSPHQFLRYLVLDFSQVKAYLDEKIKRRSTHVGRSEKQSRFGLLRNEATLVTTKIDLANILSRRYAVKPKMRYFHNI